MARAETATGGRSATTLHIPGDFALSVGAPKSVPPHGWRWVALTDVARLESGHTPSRHRPEYWEGDIPWLGIRDARCHHGQTITETFQTTNALGIANSSARVLPKGIVCLSRTASVGYVTVMGRPMATSQDFVNWICSAELNPRFLAYLLIAERRSLLLFASGTTHQTIYFPEVKAFNVCIPSVSEQARIVAILDEAFEGIDAAVANTEKNLASARELFSSYSAGIFGKGEKVWQASTLGADVSLLTGFAFRSQAYTSDDGGVRLLRGDNIVQGQLRWDDVKRWPDSDRTSYSDYELAKDDIVLAMDRTWIKAGIKFARISQKDLPALLVQRVARMRCRPTLLDGFLFNLLGSKHFEKYVLDIQTGLGVPHISGKQIQAFRFERPDIPTQRRVVEKADTVRTRCEKLVANYECKLRLLSELKRSILRKAFAGELTARDAEAVQDAAA